MHEKCSGRADPETWNNIYNYTVLQTYMEFHHLYLNTFFYFEVYHYYFLYWLIYIYIFI